MDNPPFLNISTGFYHVLPLLKVMVFTLKSVMIFSATRFVETSEAMQLVTIRLRTIAIFRLRGTACMAGLATKDRGLLAKPWGSFTQGDQVVRNHWVQQDGWDDGPANR